jgi:hypothetical protein
MTIKPEKGSTGFSVIRLENEDLRNLPQVVLPQPEPPSQDLLEKIDAAKAALSQIIADTEKAAR